MNRKPLTFYPELHPIPVHSPWYHVGMDFIGPLSPVSSNGNRFILTLSDYFSKWAEAVPLPTKEATGVAESLMKVYMKLYKNNVCSHTYTIGFVNLKPDKIAHVQELKFSFWPCTH